MTDKRLRVLLIKDFLIQYTDDDHYKSIKEILEYLEDEHAVQSNRITVDDDLEALGATRRLRRERGHVYEYALLDRDFDFEDLGYLTDAVRSTQFLSQGKIEKLVEKLQKLGSCNWTDALAGCVHVPRRPQEFTRKSELAYALDEVRRALAEKRQLSFDYYKYNLDGKFVLRNEGRPFVVTPVALAFVGGRYYLSGYDPDFEQVHQFRLDRMQGAEMTDEPAEQNDVIQSFKVDEMVETTFGMYGSSDGVRTVTLLFDEENEPKRRNPAYWLNEAYDRFGAGATVVYDKEKKASRMDVRVQVSPLFFGWLAQMQGAVRIEGPADVRDAYIAHLKKALEVAEK